MEIFSRTELLIGQEGLEKLKTAKAAIFGVGGVGSYTVEALARAGIGHLVLTDFDHVEPSNINRQLCALHSTIGQSKVEVLRKRILDINPSADVSVRQVFVSRENVESLVEKDYSYIVDAVDNITAKVAIIEKAVSLGIPVVSSMGAGNRLDPAGLSIVDLSETRNCPLARVMRRELRKRGITQGVPVVYSAEPALKPRYHDDPDSENTPRKRPPGSISFVPAVAGLYLASRVVRDLLGK